MTNSGGTSSLDVLAGLGTQDRKVLARVARRLRLRAGASVYSHGDLAQHFYIVESGRVRVFYHSPAGREPTVSYRAAGDLFGISHLAEGGRRITSAQAVEPSVIWAIANSDLADVTRHLPALATGIIKALALRLRDVMVLVESVATWPVRLRVANFLLANRDSQERQGPVVKQGWTHETIADLLGCTRQTVTEALNEFARAGWIRVQRRRIVLLDPLALHRILAAGVDGPPGAPARKRPARKQ
jgi:CRP/FNR family transcriptional regulator, cyclic AMP receptor protein